MKIKPQYLYPIKQVAEYLNVTERNLQILAKKQGRKKVDNRYLFSGHEVLEMASVRNEKRTEAKAKKNIDKRILRLINSINDDEAIVQVLTSFDSGNHIEEFTQDEYQNFIDRLKEANYLENRIAEYKEEIARMQEYVLDYRNNIEYLKKSLDKQNEQMDLVLHQIRDRSIIEATEKKILKKQVDI